MVSVAYPKRRQSLATTARYVLAVLVIFWALRTWWFYSNSLPARKSIKERSSAGRNEDDSLIGDIHADNDDDDLGTPRRKPGSQRVASDDQEDETFAEVENNTGGDKKLNSYFISEYKRDGDFWVKLFSKSTKYSQAISWSDPRIQWFLGGQCAVKSLSLDDRITVNCAEQPLIKALSGSKHQRVKALSTKLHRLSKARGRQCPMLESFLRKPLQDIDLQTWRAVDPEEILLVHDSIKPADSIVATARDVKKALRESNRLVVEKLVPDPLLLATKKFSLRMWVFPLRLQKPMLAYFGLGDLALAKKSYDRASQEIDVHVPSLRGGMCFEDLKVIAEVPPSDIILPHLQRISLLVLAAVSDTAPSSSGKEDAFVMSPPICLDFEFDQSSRAWLTNWNIGDACDSGGPVLKPACQSSADLSHYLDLSDKYVSDKTAFEAKKRYKSLGLLVDEAQFSEIEDEICYSTTAPYDTFVQQRQVIQDRVRYSVFRDGEGKPKTTFAIPRDSSGFKCPKCGYINHQSSQYCDLCGTRLVASSLLEADKRATRKGPAVDDPHNYRAKLNALFQKHDPHRVASIDVLLDRYKGEEEALILRLTRQYSALSKNGP